MSETILRIPVRDLHPSPNNPRQTYHEASIVELAESIKSVGQIGPISIRDKDGKWEIVAGHRRVKAIERNDGPDGLVECIRRDLSDEEALELALVENASREDVHPMEEALAFEQLLGMGLTEAELTNKTGKRTSYIASRMRLLGLGSKARLLFLENRMTLDAAYILARVDESTQDVVFKKAKISDGDVIADYDVEQALRMVLRRLSEAPWKLDVEYAKRPACSTCPHRTHAQSQLFDDGMREDEDSCTRPKCWDAKVAQDYKDTEKLFKKENSDKILGTKFEKDGEKKDLFSHGRHVNYQAPFVLLLENMSISSTTQVEAKMCVKPHESYTNDEGEVTGKWPKLLRWSDGYRLVFGKDPGVKDEGIYLGKDNDGFARILLHRDVANQIAKAFKKPKDPNAMNWQTGRTNAQEAEMIEARKKARARKKAGEKIAPALVEVVNSHTDLRSVLVILWNTYPFARANETKLQEMQATVSAMTPFEVADAIQKLVFRSILAEKDWIENPANHIAARLLGFDIDGALEAALTPPPKKERKAKDPKPEGEKKKGKGKGKKKTEEAPAEEPAAEEEE